MKVVLALVVLVWNVAAANAVTYTYLLGTDLDNGSPIIVFETAETAAQFYGYSTTNPDSANLPFEGSRRRATAFMHRDTNTGILSIGVLFNRFNSRTLNSTDETSFSLSGAPVGTSLTVMDDPMGMGDLYPASGPNGSYVFTYNRSRTDGFMLSGFETIDFTVSLDFLPSSDLSRFQFVNADGTFVSLSSGASEIIFSAEADGPLPVPVPASAVLLLCGVAGLGTIKFRRVKRS